MLQIRPQASNQILPGRDARRDPDRLTLGTVGIDLLPERLGRRLSTPEQSRAELAPQITVPWIKNALYWDFGSPADGR